VHRAGTAERQQREGGEIDATRTSSAMRMSTMRWMPAAAAVTSICKGSPMCVLSALRDAAMSSFCAPPRK